MGPTPPVAGGGGGDVASSSSSASASSSHGSRARPFSKGVRLRRRCRRYRGSLSVAGASSCDGVQELALPLGMSFAAVVAQVLDTRAIPSEGIHLTHLTEICSIAVKESVTNIYGNRFDCFIKNFEKSFGSTLRTLRYITEYSGNKQGNGLHYVKKGNPIMAENLRDCDVGTSVHQEFEENFVPSCLNNQLVIHEEVNQQLGFRSYGESIQGKNYTMLSTFERSVNEQARSNRLKEIELMQNLKELELRQAQLAISSDANTIGRINISMGMEKASFREEKFKSQKEETKHAELQKRLIDFELTGVIIMFICFFYATSVYSYQRITEVTSACNTIEKESKWFIPKSVSLFTAGLRLFRCHLVAFTRLFFGAVMILAVLWLIFQRSAMAGPSMPITFNVVLLGIVCAAPGKICVDWLGGNGLHWLIFWEIFCSLHCLTNVLPSLFYGILYGPISVSRKPEFILVPYWTRRYSFYAFLLIVLPVCAGLFPFASVTEWVKHFSGMIMAAEWVKHFTGMIMAALASEVRE